MSHFIDNLKHVRLSCIPIEILHCSENVYSKEQNVTRTIGS